MGKSAPERKCELCGEEIHHDEPAAEIRPLRSPSPNLEYPKTILVHQEPCAEALLKRGYSIA